MKLLHRDAVIATLAYADIFNFPLTGAEVTYWLRGSGKITRQDLGKTAVVTTLKSSSREYYSLPGRRGLVFQRRERLLWSRSKWQIAAAVGKWLKLVPTLKLVGVTGGVAMNNAKKEDDVDLFFVTSAGTLWISRFLATLLIEILGKRRRPEEREFQDKVCLNMFMSEDCLTLPIAERDLFAAHEVLQLVPLWEREGTYRHFLQANRWVKQFLPNAWKIKSQITKLNYPAESNFLNLMIIGLLRLLELPVKQLQLWYMRRHRTREVISGGVLRFHPRDARAWIKQKLAIRLVPYNIPLDKVFYAR